MQIVTLAGGGTVASVPSPAAAGQLQYETVGSFALWNATNLTLGTVYDLHMTARDAKGNLQTRITTIAGVRTMDSTQPQLLRLTTTIAATGNRYTLAVNATKPGTLYYMATKAGAPTPTRQHLLQPGTYPATANFSGQLFMPTANRVSSIVLCIADPLSLTLWAVQQDLEGQFPGRTPNYSNVTAAQRVVEAANTTTCAPAARMQALRIDAALSASSTGWPVGLPLTFPQRAFTTSPSANSTQGPSWTREYALVGGIGGVVGSGGALIASVDGSPVGLATYSPSRPLPASISIVLQTPVLYLETSAVGLAFPGANATTDGLMDGATAASNTLRFAFQLLDAASRSTVAMTGVSVVPSMAVSGGSPVALPNCTLSWAGLGVGVCSVVVPANRFPGRGTAAAATVQATVFSG